mmetsp:Transcript_101915/g.202351  ORF Transcript_101915/g.202351 Transcript_101915/m.202351 type:complete len:131 (+) Transcript_101915:1427-1819(+)
MGEGQLLALPACVTQPTRSSLASATLANQHMLRSLSIATSVRLAALKLLVARNRGLQKRQPRPLRLKLLQLGRSKSDQRGAVSAVAVCLCCCCCCCRSMCTLGAHVFNGVQTVSDDARWKVYDSKARNMF